MLLQPKSFERPTTVYCRGFNKRVSIFNCMSAYVDANALKLKERPCYGCPQGEEVRCIYARS